MVSTAEAIAKHTTETERTEARLAGVIKRWRKAAANGDDATADTLEADRADLERALERAKARAEALEAERQAEAEQDADKAAQREARKAREQAAKVQAAFDEVGSHIEQAEAALVEALGDWQANGKAADGKHWQKWKAHARAGGRFDTGSVAVPDAVRRMRRLEARVTDLAHAMHTARR